MRAVVFDGQLKFQQNVPEVAAVNGMIVVDVLKAGICETDLQLCRGYMGFSGIPGHEFVGVARSGQYVGQRVVGEINCSCGVCQYCLDGLQNHCPFRTVIGILNHPGAFADSVVVPEKNLHRIPDQVSDQQAVFVEPLAAACRIPQQIQIDGSEQVVVLGDGRLGNLCAQVLQHHGCQVLVVGKHQLKLHLLQQMGISTRLLHELPQERLADIVVDCTGSTTGLETAVRLVRPCGTIVLKTTVAAAQSMQMAPIVIDEIRVIGSRCGPFDEAIRMLAAGAVQVDPLISARFPLEAAETAFEHAVRPDVLKVLLEVSASS